MNRLLPRLTNLEKGLWCNCSLQVANICTPGWREKQTFTLACETLINSEKQPHSRTGGQFQPFLHTLQLSSQWRITQHIYTIMQFSEMCEQELPCGGLIWLKWRFLKHARSTELQTLCQYGQPELCYDWLEKNPRWIPMFTTHVRLFMKQVTAHMNEQRTACRNELIQFKLMC